MSLDLDLDVERVIARPGYACPARSLWQQPATPPV